MSGRNTTLFLRGPSKLHLAYTQFSMYVHTMQFFTCSYAVFHSSLQDNSKHLIHTLTNFPVFIHDCFTPQASCHSLETFQELYRKHSLTYGPELRCYIVVNISSFRVHVLPLPTGCLFIFKSSKRTKLEMLLVHQCYCFFKKLYQFVL